MSGSSSTGADAGIMVATNTASIAPTGLAALAAKAAAAKAGN